MSYLVLARKWRPMTFDDLVGQEHVAQTLQNAITQGRVAHAFLFTGPRGVGKTTVARVLAKALNCLATTAPTGAPCTKCAACEEIAKGTDPDVKEIDGASNNSVDDVRKLQESLPYVPHRDRFKVVIIDEVHMLSVAAFNALLKTLEEPPPHVKFIFATTEVHKVLPTILSRCQRYDFKLIATHKIRERVEHILRTENIAHDAASVALVSREAAGSMRDALSLLDQVIAGSAEGLTGAEASRLLGVAHRSVFYDLSRALLGGDAPAALKIVDVVAREGYDLAVFSRGLLGVLRDLVVARVMDDPGELLDVADDERADLTAIARGADAQDLERLFVAWSETTDIVARSREPRWAVEMALVRLAHRPALRPIDEILARMAEMERRLGGGAPSPGGGGSPRGASGPGGVRPSTPSAAPNRAFDGRTSGSNRASGPTGASSASSAPGEGSPAWLSSAQSRSNEPRNFALAVDAAPDPHVLTSPAPASVTVPVPVPAAAPAARTHAPDPQPAGPRAPSSELAQPIDVSRTNELLEDWQAVLAGIESGVVAVLKHGVPLSVSAEKIRVAYEAGSFYARRASSDDIRKLLGDAAERVFGRRPEVDVVLGAVPADAPTLARREEIRRFDEIAEREAAARAHPSVRKFLELVGGEVRSVKLDGGRGQL